MMRPPERKLASKVHVSIDGRCGGPDGASDRSFRSMDAGLERGRGVVANV
jgi:hypothetical protein